MNRWVDFDYDIYVFIIISGVYYLLSSVINIDESHYQVCKTSYEKKCKPSYNYGQVRDTRDFSAEYSHHLLLDLRKYSQAKL